jgi:Arc/MetJ-type ribon-helix-helix transcriptional regulator
MEIPVSREWEEWILAHVNDGAFESAGELLHQALRLLRDHLEDPELKLALLRRDIRIGLEAADRGEVAPFDPDELKRRLRERMSAQSREEESTVPSRRAT